MKTTYFKHIIFAVLLGHSVILASAQQDTTKLHKEVEVVKAYKPSISDAYKINDMPQIAAPSNQKPTFDYQIKTQPMITNFSIEPVQAAQMVTRSRIPLNQGLLKLGLGNYLTQYGEFFYNSKASRYTNIGLHLKTHLSNGKIKLDNEDKVKAPNNNNLAEFFVNSNLRSGLLSTKVFVERKSFRYFGYTGDKLTVEEKEMYMPMWDEKQAFPRAGLSLSYSKRHDPRANLNFQTGLKYQYFGTKTGQKEHLFNWNGLFSAPIDLMEGVLDAGITYSSADSVYTPHAESTGKRNQFVLKANPSAEFTSDMLKFRLGLNSYTVFEKDQGADYLLAPNTRIEFTPVKNVITVYAGTDGYLEQNNYSVIATENPFVRPDQNVKNAKYRYILTGGIRGKFTPDFSYGLQADYANIRNQHFYYLNNMEITEASVTSYNLDNTFDVEYDKVKQFTFGGELQYALNQEVNIRFQAKYHSYSLDSLAEAWLKPSFESSASFYFDPEGPVSFTADISFIGQRKALIRTTYSDLDVPNAQMTVNDEISTLDAIVNLNMGVEYQFSENLSFWGRANNYSFKKYELFPGYTTPRFSMLIGASFTF